jgi:hypothetical protein
VGDPKKLAKNAAMRSTMLYRMGAVISAPNGFILGKGFNTTSKGNPLAYDWSTHAEIVALRCALKKYKPGSYGCWTIWVVRLNAKGDEMRADPCNRCDKILRALGVEMRWSAGFDGVWV